MITLNNIKNGKRLSLLKKNSIKEIIRFGVVGVVATGIHYLTYIFLIYFINESLAFTLGYIISFCFNFILSAKFTFNSNITFKRSTGFILCHIINYTLQIFVLNLSICLGVKEAFAPIIVYFICIPINFILVRYVFKH